MFIAAIIVSFAFGIRENGIECSTIRYRVGDVNDVKNSTYITANLTFSKDPDNSKSNDQSTILPIKKIEINGSGILLLDRKTERLESKVDRQREPKFIGSLALLAGLNPERLANAAPGSADLFTKLSNGVVSLYLTLPGYFAGFYNPQQLFPYPNPVLQYPTSTPASLSNNNPQNLVSENPVIPSLPPVASPPEPIPEQIANFTDDEVPPRNNATTSAEGNLQPLETQTPNDEVQTNQVSAATEVDSRRIVSSNENNDSVPNNDSPVVGEGTELRLFGFGETATTTTTTTTTAVPNVTVSTIPVENTTGSKIPFYGYYGGLPQDVGHVAFTTEDPQQRYLKDYTEDIFPLPFERPAIFNPYPNVASYSNPFVNSFTAAERFPEFLNTVESDRYLYDTENQRNFNGFRPILK